MKSIRGRVVIEVSGVMVLLTGCGTVRVENNTAVSNVTVRSQNASQGVQGYSNGSSVSLSPTSTPIASNDSQTQANSVQFTNEMFGFTFSVPPSWKNFYIVKSFTPQGGRALRIFDFNYSVEKPPSPFILELAIYPKTDLRYLKRDPAVLKVFSNDKYAFAFYKDKEHAYPKVKTYKQIQGAVPWVLHHFIVQPSNPLLNTTLMLPTGKILRPDGHLMHWKDLTLSLNVTTFPPANVTTRPYGAVVGNHANIMSHTFVSTPFGQATLVHFQRSQPAASQSNVVQNDYDVIFFGNPYAYVLNVLVRANPGQAKNEVKQILSGWRIPTG